MHFASFYSSSSGRSFALVLLLVLSLSRANYGTGWQVSHKSQGSNIWQKSETLCSSAFLLFWLLVKDSTTVKRGGRGGQSVLHSVWKLPIKVSSFRIQKLGRFFGSYFFSVKFTSLPLPGFVETFLRWIFNTLYKPYIGASSSWLFLVVSRCLCHSSLWVARCSLVQKTIPICP